MSNKDTHRDVLPDVRTRTHIRIWILCTIIVGNLAEDEELRGKAKSESPGPGRKVIYVGRNNLKRFSGSLSGSRIAGISHTPKVRSQYSRDSEIAMSPLSDFVAVRRVGQSETQYYYWMGLQDPAYVLPVGDFAYYSS